MALQLPKIRSPLFVIVIALAVILILVFVIASSSKQMSALKQQLSQKQQEVASLSSQNEDLQRRLASIDSERKMTESKVNELRSQLLAASTELTRARSSVSDIQNSYEMIVGEKSSLESRIGQLISERDEARSGMQKLISEKSELERSSQRLQQKILFLQRDYQQLSDKIKEAQEKERISAAPPVTVSGRTEEQEPSAVSSSYSQTIELPPIVVKKDSAATALPVRAQVVEANSAKRFVVIDKGSNDGVTNGMNFDILRGGNKIAQVVAVRVRPTIAACDVSFSQSPQVLRSGDTAVQRSQ